MTDHSQYSFVTRSQLVSALTHLREEWEQAADGDPLTGLEANVGLFLADLAKSFSLTPEEQVQVLGIELVSELRGILVSTPGNNGAH